MYQRDPLFIVDPRNPCPDCGGRPGRKKVCDLCRKTGHAPIRLAGTWSPRPGFLVCGGPSLNSYPLEELRRRGVVSLGVNNAAAHAPCTAFTFGDPQWKFHSSLFLDPKVMVFAPTGKLCRRVRHQMPDGSFRFTDQQLAKCPAVYGVARRGEFNGRRFLSDWYAHWGRGGKGKGATNRPFTRLATMLMGIRLLHYLGCPRVYMIGVDFWMTREEPYAWGGHRTSGNRIWWKIDSMLGDLRRTFRRARFEVYNCNEQSKCETFPHVPWSEAINDCRGPIDAEPFDLNEWYSHNRMQADRASHPEIVPYEQLPRTQQRRRRRRQRR